MRFSQSLQLSLALAGAATAKTVTVQVSDSNNQLKFFPSSVQADMGDMVQFVFNPANHSVAESASYEKACEPMSAGAGWNSGFMPVSKGATDMPTYTVMINDTNPHWFYCAQGEHCEAGMVGVINPPSNETADGFANNAAMYSKTTIPESIYGGTAGMMTSSNSTMSNSSSMASSMSMASSGTMAAGGMTTGGAMTSAGAMTTGGAMTSAGAMSGSMSAAATTASKAGAAGNTAAGAGLAAAAGAVAAMFL